MKKPMPKTVEDKIREPARYQSRIEKQIRHLNAVLKAVHDINRLIMHERDVQRLIQETCNALISSREYSGAWIIVISGDSEVQEHAFSGPITGFEEFVAKIKVGFVPDCIRSLREDPGIGPIFNPGKHCRNCSITETGQGDTVVLMKIMYQDRVQGYLAIRSASSILEDDDEVAVLVQFSENIGFALNNIRQLKKITSTEQEVIRAKDDWERTFNAIPDLIALIDSEHRIQRLNEAMAAKLDCSATEATGRYCYEIVHGLDSVPAFCPHARTLQTGNGEHEVVDEPRLGGTFDVTTTPLFRDESGKTGSVHVARDVTASRKKEQLMSEHIALGEFALNHPLQDILTQVVDKAEMLTGSRIGFIHFLENEEQTIFLYSWSTSTKKNFCTATGDTFHYPVAEAGVWADCLRERKPLIHNDFDSLPNRKGMPEGHAVVTRLLTLPVFQGDKIVAILGVGNKPVDYDETDIGILSQITGQVWEYVVSKRFEEALHQSEQYARALLDAIPDMIFRMNRKGVYIDYKGATEDLYIQSTSIIGKNNRDLTPPYFADLIDEKISETLAGNKMVMFEYQLEIPGKGLRDFEARMVPGGADEIIAISRDITERKKTDLALKKKIEELEWFNHLMIDRELKMIELKKEINALLVSAGKQEKYVVHQDPAISYNML